MSEWERVTITVPADFSDIVSEFIITATSRGVELKDDTSGQTVITAWLSRREVDNGLPAAIEEFLERTLPASAPRPGLEYREIMDADWSEKWKEFFKPIRVGRHFVIRPGWEPFEPGPGDLVIEIDPGQAFGVGTHASTALMLENIEWLWAHSSSDNDFVPAVLDVGTGTGILSIAAARMGAGHVTAIDIDHEAVRAAAENVRLNGTEHIVSVSATPIEKIREKFDVVLANIDRNTLRLLAPHLAAVLKPGGMLLISGILTGQQAEVAGIFAKQGLSVIRATSGSGAGDTGSDEWACLVLK